MKTTKNQSKKTRPPDMFEATSGGLILLRALGIYLAFCDF
jgi:hypothetical protein